jgi:hypothetical protein
VQRRKLTGFCCGTAVLGLLLAPSATLAEPAPAVGSGGARAQALPASSYLVRAVVYNELHDHDTHGYWRYWVEKHSSKETQLQEQVETPSGPVSWLESSNGRPIDADAREDEDRKLEHLLSSPSEQAQHRKEYAEDERRIGRILSLLPEAFLYEPAELEARTAQMQECPCYHLRFHPNPDYPAHSIEARIFHAMVGDIWISAESTRLVRLDGKLQSDVDFGYGILGRLYRDGWFRLERTKVVGGAGNGFGNGDWKTERLEVHMSGRAMLFKTIARETSEVRGGFTPVPAGLSLQQAAAMLREPVASLAAQPASFISAR